MLNISTRVRLGLNALIITSAALLFSACSQKKETVQEYNKPALYWYNKMAKEIAFGDIDAADDTYTSLQSEHKNSPLIATSLQILANAHIEEEQYLLANYYLDEYIKRFALSKNIDYIRYLKIKANYSSLAANFREQNLISKTIEESNEFITKFQQSPYLPLVETINARLYMAKASLDKEIADLYRRIGKDKASEIYNDKVKKNWTHKDEIEPVDVPWYRDIFENY